MENLGASPKKMILLFWCGIPCIQQFQIGNSRNQSTDFNLSLPAQISCVQAIYFRCGAEEAVISLFRRAPCIQHFQSVKSPHSGFFSIFLHLPIFHALNSFISGNSWRPTKEATILLFSRSNLYITISKWKKCIVLFFLFYYVTTYSNCMRKSCLFPKL